VKRIAIFNDYQLPLPAIRGGSVPTLTNFILEQNEKEQKFEIDVYSCHDENALVESKKYKYARFIYSKDANKVRFVTNLKFVLKTKLHFPFDLSAIPLPKSAKQHFMQEKYDVVYINGYIRGAIPIINIAKEKGSAIIVHHHVVTDVLNEPTIPGKEIVDKSDRLLFVSEFAANYARVGCEKENSKMGVLLNAIDTNRFKFKDKFCVRKEIRDKFGISENDIVILFVGRMVEGKGALELIKGFNEADLGASVKLMIVVGATYSSKKVTPYIQKCFDEAKKNDNIIFTGYIDYSDIPKYYAASDISTLISCCDEAAGLVGIESMAAGLPIITTDRGGIGEYVADNCKIVTQDDDYLVQNITKAITTLVQNEDMRNKMGSAGLERSKIFDKATYYVKFAEIVESIN